jgi:hypothetical protein
LRERRKTRRLAEPQPGDARVLSLEAVVRLRGGRAVDRARRRGGPLLQAARTGSNASPPELLHEPPLSLPKFRC